nr:DUF4129 domain-containing protein [Chloroflexota bacterium]
MSTEVATPMPTQNGKEAADSEPRRVNWRKEMLYLGLAAMESCWFAPWLALILGSGYRATHIPFAAIFSTLLLGMYATRFLTYREISLRMQRVITILLAVLNSLALLRLFIYINYKGHDFSWLGYFVWQVGNIFQSIPPALIVFLANLHLWARGINLAQRDLSVDSLGFSFRVGIIAFFWFFLVRIFGAPVDAIPHAFLYFFLGLIVVGLGRIETVSRTHLGIRSPFTASWMAILTSATLMVSGLSIALATLLSLRNISLILKNLGMVIAAWLGKVVSPLLAILAFLLDLFITSLIYLFRNIFGAESKEVAPFIRIVEGLQLFQPTEPAQGVSLLILQVLKWGFLSLLFLIVLAILAVSVGRARQTLLGGRSGQYETVWDRDNVAKEVHDAVENRWRKLFATLQAHLARFRGREYALTTIRQIYGSLVKLATATGFPRREAETPYEYLATLRKAFPYSEKEVRLITEAYVRAHYGQRSFSPRYVQRVRDAWLAIRDRQEQEESGNQHPRP